VEAAVLLWVADRIKSDFLGLFALAAIVLGVARLLFFDDFNSTTLIFNARMATYGVALAVLGWLAWFGSRRSEEQPRQLAAMAIVVLNVLALVALSHEIADFYSGQMARISHYAGNGLPYADYRSVQIARDFTYSALFMAYGAMLMIIGFWRRSSFIRWQALFLIAATIIKVFVYDVSELDRIYRILSFIVLGALLLAISFAYQRDWLKLSIKPAQKGPAHS